MTQSRTCMEDCQGWHCSHRVLSCSASRRSHQHRQGWPWREGKSNELHCTAEEEAWMPLKELDTVLVDTVFMSLQVWSQKREKETNSPSDAATYQFLCSTVHEANEDCTQA